MGNKAAIQLELSNGEAQVLQGEAMSVNEEGCSGLPSAAAGASDGSGDDERAYERAYGSPAEAEEEGAELEAVTTLAPGEGAEEANIFSRNKSETSTSNNQPSAGSPRTDAVAVRASEQMTVANNNNDAAATAAAAAAAAAAAEPVLPPPPPVLPLPSVPPSAVANELQLPPLNDPSGSEEAPRLSARGSPSSSGDHKGAHVEVSVFKYQPGVQTPVEQLHNYRISSRGGAITGSLTETEERRGENVSGSVDIAAEYEKRKGSQVVRHHIKDHRAKQLLVVPNDDKFVAVAAPEAFSRHSGTCMILGGQGAYGNGTSKSYELKLGNFLRIGSVGVVVSEIHTGAGGEHKCLSWEELTCLKGDIAAIRKACETACSSLCGDLVTIEALTAQEENAEADKLTGVLQNGGGGVVNTRMCYMCFDDVDEPGNPLVAPCECKGDTRYVHLNCLQKWHTTTSENKVCVVLNNKGVRVCTVCKSPYKASVRLPGGESISLFQSPLPPPYICFMVVTRHQNNEELFSTKYQLSFNSVMNRGGTASTKELVVGRSRQCDMVLDYRTVSTRHANVRFQGGRFYFSDLMSSNGSYLYLREPLQLPYGETVFLKWGSNVVSLKAKRSSIRHRLSSLVGRRATVTNRKDNPEQEFTMLESLCELGNSPSTDGAADGGVNAAVARDGGGPSL
ncbi:unnamed protein product [Ectocarpus sp. 13 AM-2016]